MHRSEMMAMAAAIALVAVGVPMLAGLLRPEPPAPGGRDLALQRVPAGPQTGREDERVAIVQPAPAEIGRRPETERGAAETPRSEDAAKRQTVVAAQQAQSTAPPAAPRGAPTREASQRVAPPPAARAVVPDTGRTENGRSRLGLSAGLGGGGTGGSFAPPPLLDGSTAASGRLPASPPEGRDRFASAGSNPVKSVAAEPVSTFSIDVDTASYSLVRRALNAGRLPPKEAVRVEEMVNYFPYAWPAPQAADPPFEPTVTVLPSPWNPANKLVHIAIKGYALKAAERPRANLVLLVDVSGSMAPADRLPLLKSAFRMLVDELRPEDTVSIVTYASGSDIRLKPTLVADKPSIVAAIDSLAAGGSTHGAAGIQDAYRVAELAFDKAAVNRVILATDGDWNVGITDRGQLQSFIEGKRQTGIYLSILGVGMGNHNDALMQTLAQNGNGVAAYIDTLAEARKVLVEEASSTLFPIAKDVKIQVELNPARVAEYRLIGYETRALRREDFANDKVDAGDIGSGHTVTAIYEITPVEATRVAEGELRYGKDRAGMTNGRGDAVAPLPVGAEKPLLHADAIVHGAERSIATGHVEVRLAGGILRAEQLVLDRSSGKVTVKNFQIAAGQSDTRGPALELPSDWSEPIARLLVQRAGSDQPVPMGKDAEYAFLRLRYKLPSEDVSKLIEIPVGPGLEKRDMAEVPADVRFSVAVAGFGQLLRGSPHLGGWGFDDAIALADSARGDDPWGYRAELVKLARIAKSARR